MIYLDHLLKSTEGILIYPGKQDHFEAFSHDTRQLLPGELFVAVRGEHGNGHDYALEAAQKGAGGLLLEAQALNALSEETRSALEATGVTTISVDDTRLALQRYAQFILQCWHPTVIAVTGSTGKTSTKEAIAGVLASHFATFKSWQNYNDLLGLPLSLGRLEERHEYAVLELGCDHPGEIGDLCRIVRPQIGVLTNISAAQLQYFGSLERLSFELGALLTSLPDEGHFFYNQDDETICALLEQYSKVRRHSINTHPFAPPLSISVPPGYRSSSPARVTYVGWDGIRGALATLVMSEGAAGDVSSAVREVELASHLLGEHHLATMLAAYQVALSRGVARVDIERALLNVYPMPGRLNPLAGVRNSRLLDDTHNAAPR